jgi:hypothetical protein
MMKHADMIPAVLGAILALTTPAASAQEIKYNSFDDRTIVSAHSSSLMSGPSVDFLAMYSGKRPLAPPPDVILLFSASKPASRFLRCSTFALLADGKPVPVERTMHQDDVGDGYVVETVIAAVPFAVAQQLAVAQTVESNICGDETTFNAEDVGHLRSVVRAVTPPSGFGSTSRHRHRRMG